MVHGGVLVASMSKTIMLARKIKSLRKGKSFDVPTNSDRMIASQVARTLLATGGIDFQIITKANGNGGFTIFAV